MTKNDKTAIKLLAKYADSYNLLEEENKSLKIEVKDLKKNLKLNKEIIEDLFKKSNANDLNQSYIDKLKEEIKNLNIQIDKIIHEKEEIRNKLTYVEQIWKDALEREKQNNEKLLSLNLIMENQIVKRDNQIAVLKKKIEKFLEKDDGDFVNIEKEIYITDPNLAFNYIYDELYCYKQGYEKMSRNYEEVSFNLNKYKKVVYENQIEISKLKEMLKESRTASLNNIALQNRDICLTPTLKCSKLKFDEDHSLSPFNSRPKDSPLAGNAFMKKIINKSQCHGNNSSHNEEASKVKIHGFESEEWLEILKMVNITPEEIDRFSKNKMLSKIIEAIEVLNKLLLDKNLQIRLLEKENELLNGKNSDLNKENMKLIRKVEEFYQIKKDNKNKNNHDSKDVDSSHSMVSSKNNGSKITIKNLNINSINSFKKIYENNRMIRPTDNSPSKNENIQSGDISDYETHLSKLYKINNDIILTNNLNGQFKSKFQNLSKAKIQCASPAPDKNIPVKSENNDTETDMIEVKLNRNIYKQDKKNKSELMRKYTIDNKVDKNSLMKSISNSNIDKVKNNSETHINNNHIRHNNLYITKVKDDLSLRDDSNINDSIIDLTKNSNNQLINNTKHFCDGTIGSYKSGDVKKHYGNGNESGFISNANDLENFDIKITISNN